MLYAFATQWYIQTMVTCAGIGIAAVADTQLHRFVHANAVALKAGTKRQLVLDTGTLHSGHAHA